MTPNDPTTTPKGERPQVRPARVDKATRNEVPPRKGFSTLVHNKADTYVPPSGPAMKLKGQS